MCAQESGVESGWKGGGGCGQIYSTRQASKTRDVKHQDSDDISKGVSHFIYDSVPTQKSHNNGRCANVHDINLKAMVIAIHPASFLIFKGRQQ